MEGDQAHRGHWCEAPSKVRAPHGWNDGSRRARRATPGATRKAQATTPPPPRVLAFELGVNPWTLGFTTGAAPRPRERSRPAGALDVLPEAIARAKPRVGVPHDARVGSGSEAGREGVWLHRGRLASGVENLVGDSASLAVHRRPRRAKTERLEVHKVLPMWRRHVAGERQVWSVGRVPSSAAEDRRPLHRELLTPKRARTRVLTRRKGRRAGCGVRLARPGEVEAELEQARHWEGSALSAALRARLQREWPQVCVLTPQLEALEAERRAVLRTSAAPVVEQVRQLATLRGLGVNSAWLLGMGCFAWRDLKTSTPVGAFAGLTPTPDQSGQASRARGMPKAGHGDLRTMAVEMAWGWVRFQPESPLPQWDQARFGRGRARLRDMGMVALARKLLSARWRFLNTTGRPAGAILKAQVAV